MSASLGCSRSSARQTTGRAHQLELFEPRLEPATLPIPLDHRGDCKQVCLALLVTRQGLPFGYEVLAGNRVDVTTVEEIVSEMEDRFGIALRVWMMDRGMSWSASWPKCFGSSWSRGAIAPASVADLL